VDWPPAIGCSALACITAEVAVDCLGRRTSSCLLPEHSAESIGSNIPAVGSNKSANS
jgi:hypothetical protein